MKHKNGIVIGLLFVASLAFGQSPSFKSFDTNFFTTNNFRIGINTQGFSATFTNFGSGGVSNLGTAAYSNATDFIARVNGNGQNADLTNTQLRGITTRAWDKFILVYPTNDRVAVIDSLNNLTNTATVTPAILETLPHRIMDTNGFGTNLTTTILKATTNYLLTGGIERWVNNAGRPLITVNQTTIDFGTNVGFPKGGIQADGSVSFANGEFLMNPSGDILTVNSVNIDNMANIDDTGVFWGDGSQLTNLNATELRTGNVASSILATNTGSDGQPLTRTGDSGKWATINSNGLSMAGVAFTNLDNAGYIAAQKGIQLGGTYSNWNRFGWTNTALKIANGRQVSLMTISDGLSAAGHLFEPFMRWTTNQMHFAGFRSTMPYNGFAMRTFEGGASQNLGQDGNYIKVRGDLNGAGSIVYISNNIPQLDQPANVFAVIYLQTAGAGTFNIQTQQNGGTWTTVSGFGPVDANGGSTEAKIAAWTNPTPVNATMRCVAVSGAVALLDASRWDSTASNSFTVCHLFGNSSVAMNQYIVSRDNVLKPILQWWAPDLCVFSKIGISQADCNYLDTNSVDSLFHMVRTNSSGTNVPDMILTGLYPFTSSYTGCYLGQEQGIWENSYLNYYAKTNGAGWSFWDGWTPFVNHSNMAARGFIPLNNVHATLAGFSAYGELLSHWLSLGNYLPYPLPGPAGPSGATATFDPAQFGSSASGTNIVTGVNLTNVFVWSSNVNMLGALIIGTNHNSSTNLFEVRAKTPGVKSIHVSTNGTLYSENHIVTSGSIAAVGTVTVGSTSGLLLTNVGNSSSSTLMTMAGIKGGFTLRPVISSVGLGGMSEDSGAMIIGTNIASAGVQKMLFMASGTQGIHMLGTPRYQLTSVDQANYTNTMMDAIVLNAVISAKGTNWLPYPVTDGTVIYVGKNPFWANTNQLWLTFPGSVSGVNGAVSIVTTNHQKVWRCVFHDSRWWAYSLSLAQNEM